MLFNSFDFIVFLPIVFTIYWFLKNHLRLQNLFLLAASYIFYGWWDWRFLSLIAFSSLTDFTAGFLLARMETVAKKRSILLISLVVNLGLLGVFKYYNFFLESFIEAFSFLGMPMHPEKLKIILPVGISFYTFQTLSYSIDVYRGKISPAKDPITFFVYVSFFPQLVAGPIERASNLLPQFSKNRVFNYGKAVDGCRQMLWGFFKKVVIADNCAPLVNTIFGNPGNFPGSILLIGAFLFSFQIYCDFSGYSDIAIGTARLFGIDLRKNFAYPYFSRDIAEFWRRWHISLTSWFRDYVYIPLGGSRICPLVTARNTIVIFVISGFWHGANLTFIAWGGIHALYFMPLLLGNRNRRYLSDISSDRLFPSFVEIFQMGRTFCLTAMAWVFFRSDSIGHAMTYLQLMLSPSFFSLPFGYNLHTNDTLTVILLIILMVGIEWVQRGKSHALDLQHHPLLLRWSAYYAVLILIVFFGEFNIQEFIYFQF